MTMEILTESGGDSVLFARYTGGILSLSTKKSGGILSGGDFVLHSAFLASCKRFSVFTYKFEH